MEVRRPSDPSSFLDEAGPLLLEDEARHNLLLGLAGTLRDDPGRYPEFRLWVVADAGEVVGAALQTPPHNLVVARPARAGAIEALAEAVDDDLPGLTAANPEAQEFAALWSSRHGVAPRLRFAQGVYALERVLPVPTAPGRMRDMAAADLPLVRAWWLAFGREALHGEELDEAELARSVDARLRSPHSGAVLWEDDGRVVSLAGFGGATPNGIRIGPVYTPPERRGRGYATALVAEQSQALLDAGRRFCFLYTDLANPTANAIYRRIGYELACESAEFRFERDGLDKPDGGGRT